MKVVDFDAPFRAALTDWMRKNAGRYRNADEMEAHVGEVYARWSSRRAEWLDGLSPAEYFARFTDADELVRGLGDYEAAGVGVPELMLNRIVQLGEAAVRPLMALASDARAGAEARVTALNLLIELDTSGPMAECFRIIDAADEGDEVAEAASELLKNLGEAAAPGMLERLDTASGSALSVYLDLLCNFPGDERIYTYTVREFLRDGARRALYASLLARLGDPRAIGVLTRALSMEDIGYLDYLEIANAIEALGGDAPARDRDFSGDPYYEALKRLE